MAKDIKVTFEDQTFTLTFNKQSVRQMENAGFNINDIDTKPNTTIEMLFRGAFLARHVGVKESVVNTICVQTSRIQPLEQTLLLDKTIKNGLCPTAKAREQNPLLLIWSLI